MEPNFNATNYYEILGVPLDADQNEIKRKYRTLARRYHPDKVSDDEREESKAIMQKVNEAYATLKDETKRSIYDRDGADGVQDYDDLQEEEERKEGEEEERKEGEEEDQHQSYQSSFPSQFQTDEDARQAYRAEFGTEDYEEFHRGDGFIGLMYASELHEAFLNDGLQKMLTVKLWRFKITFFFGYLVKRLLNTSYAIAELSLSIIILFTWFASLADPTNTTSNWIGAIAILANSWIIHNFYGFMRYPSFTRHCAFDQLTRESLDFEFAEIRTECSVLRHGDLESRDQKIQTFLTIWSTGILHAASFFGSYACGTYMCFTNCLGGRNDRLTTEEIFEAAGGWGIIIGYLIMPIVRVAASNVSASSFATFGFFAQQHYYNSLLFKKSFPDFLLGLFVFDFFDVVGWPEKEQVADNDDGINNDDEV